ncbi:L,D-transpeptidase Cds6 family protein [Sulfuricystis multivorans]|uniref:L,D-transpeptidase Cds6 family protein n=1 Tax=Sulfuricystis multivorans TaxID=2211108 RepID=UPI000F84E7B4|nr:hypothetical protein [Sulfuricystis multivorans]
MKLKLNPLQVQILIKLGTNREMPFDQLAKSLLPARELQGMSIAEWDNEIRLTIELLAVYRVIQIQNRQGVRFCVAPDFVCRWADTQRECSAISGKKGKPSIVIPLLTATALATATTGCNTFQALTQSTPAPVVKPYNPDGTQPPERIEQFYNNHTGSMVYRFCVGDECPSPTPKKPAQRKSVVTEINPDGTTTTVEQNAAFSKGETISPSRDPAETRKALRETLATPKTASNNATAAAIAAQLNEQRRAIQAAAGVEQSPASPVTAPKMSVKTLGEGSVPAPIKTPAPAAKPSVLDKFPVLPSSGIRVPESPSAKASVPSDPMLASTNTVMGRKAVGGVKADVRVAETPMTTSNPKTNKRVFPGKANAPSDAMESTAARVSGKTQAENFLLRWASKWSAKDADAYFRLYAKDFLPSYGQAKSLSTWEQQRRSVMTRPGTISVNVKIVNVEEKNDKTSVRFWQTYESKSFKSRVLKSIELVKVDGEWKIHRERLIPV